MASASNAVPSWNFTPSRRVNRYRVASSSIVQDVASPGRISPELSTETRGSKRFPMISVAAEPDERAGSIVALSADWPQVNVPPRFGLDVAAGALGTELHAAATRPTP